jgi:hypothetical protein
MLDRNEKTLEMHKTKAQARCGKLSCCSARLSGAEIRIKRTPCSCGSYFCPRCRKILYNKLASKVLANFGKCNYTFWTLAARKPDATTPAELVKLRQNWRAFWNDLRHVYPHLKFVRVLEIAEGGNPHFHLLFNSYVSFVVVNKLWKKHTGGCHTQFKKIDSHRVAFYIAKYVSKSGASNLAHEELFYLSNTRRFSASQKLLCAPPKHFIKLEQRIVATDYAPHIMRDLISQWLKLVPDKHAVKFDGAGICGITLT